MILPPYLEIHKTMWATRGPGAPYQDSLPLVSPLTLVTLIILCGEILVKDSLSVVTNLHNKINKQNKVELLNSFVFVWLIKSEWEIMLNVLYVDCKF